MIPRELEFEKTPNPAQRSVEWTRGYESLDWMGHCFFSDCRIGVECDG